MTNHRKNRLVGLKTTGIFSLVATLWMVGSSGPVHSVSLAERVGTEDPASKDNVRGVFLGQGAETQEVVGRLAIRLLEEGGSHQVGIDHAFRSGDRFQFEITSNRDGWLTIFHRSGNEKPQVLWPRLRPSEGSAVSNHLSARATYIVPPSPAAFVFDEQEGAEFFYVTIESTATAKASQTAVDSGAKSVEGSESTREQPPTGAPTRKRLLNLKVRGLEALVKRGIVFDPGPRDEDRHVYFAPSEEDSEGVAVVKFQLQHED